MEKIKPYDWQLPVIERQDRALREKRFCLNACCTGAGKTVLALQTIKDLGSPALIVTPLVAHDQWRKTAEAMDVKNLLDVINIEKVNASKRCPWYNPTDMWKNLPPDALVVLDECHRGCSGPTSKATRAFSQLKAFRGAKLLAMSATAMVSPLQGRMIGFWAGLHNFNDRSFYDWCNRNGCGMEWIGWGLRRRSIYRFTTNVELGRRHMASIRESLGEMFIAMGPEDIPGFPDETVELMRIDLGKREQAELEKLMKTMPPEYNDFGQCVEGERDGMIETLRLRQQAEYLKSYAMADEAVAHVMNGRSVAVFLNFRGPRFVIEERLKAAGIPFISIYGGQKQSERDAAIAEFQSNRAYVAVCMMQAAGCAVSLHDKLHERMRVALISPGYDASQVKQSLGRTRRVGGTKAHQYFVLCNEIEDRVYKALEKKITCLDSLNDGDFEL